MTPLRVVGLLALVALALGDNLVGPEIATAQFRVDGAP